MSMTDLASDALEYVHDGRLSRPRLLFNYEHDEIVEDVGDVTVRVADWISDLTDGEALQFHSSRLLGHGQLLLIDTHQDSSRPDARSRFHLTELPDSVGVTRHSAASSDIEGDEVIHLVECRLDVAVQVERRYVEICIWNRTRTMDAILHSHPAAASIVQRMSLLKTNKFQPRNLHEI